MYKSNLYRFSMRFLVLLIFHFIIKLGDLTFGAFTDFTFRGGIFSIFFISYWLLIFQGADLISNMFFKQQERFVVKNKLYTYFYFLFHLAYSFLGAFTFNYLYRWGDLTFFEMQESWSDVSFLNPQLTSILWLFYIIIFSFETNLDALLKRKESQLQLEKLKQENTLALYENLRSQIEPHFLFNSLSVLSALVHTDANLAAEFILKLSKILRYVIDNKDFKLLPLKDELQLMNDYLFLMQTRFTEGIIFRTEIDKKYSSNLYLPTVSLQLLIENAIKHNKFSAEYPLKIDLFIDGDYLVFRNNLNKRNDLNSSTKQGLENLSKRYAHFTNKEIKIKTSSKHFTVSLPIFKSNKL